MRLEPSSVLLALVLLVPVASPAAALGSLEEARCTCADSAVNQGDYVSCISQMTRRLVLLGAIDRSERAEAVAEASDADLAAILAGCGSTGLPVNGWGVGLQVATPFYPDPAAGGAASTAELSLWLWNFSPEDVAQSTNVSPDDDCGYEVEILDQVGNRVRSDDSVCLPVVGELPLPAGSVERRDFTLPLLALDSETGLADGARLPVGGYTVRVTWQALGPSVDDMPSTPGVRPAASISIRVGD